MVPFLDCLIWMGIANCIRKKIWSLWRLCLETYEVRHVVGKHFPKSCLLQDYISLFALKGKCGNKEFEVG